MDIARRPDSDVALRVEGLVKRYGPITAVNGISFTVYKGEIFGLLGPNGAGKTTTLEMLEGLRRPDGGRAWVAGIDIVKRPKEVRSKIGAQLQEAGLFEKQTVRETLSTFAAFHRRSRPVEELMATLSLTEKANAMTETLSGGQRQRLSIALALLNDPEIVFLDEPTTGLDPQARRNLWDVVRAIRDEGRTVILTTHYMDEAEQLCDRIAIIDHGEVIALETPAALIETYAPGAKIHLRLAVGAGDCGELEELPAVERVHGSEEGVILFSSQPHITLPVLFEQLRRDGAGFSGLRVETGTLEDVFLRLTGRSLRE